MALVLLIDDDVMSLDLFEAILKRDRLRVIKSSSSLDAYPLTVQHRPDIVLLNDMMPYLSGGDACRYIKSLPELAHIPIILVSAGLRVYDPQYVKASCADGVLHKPCRPADVIAIVRRFVPAT
jgi:CheY-like chemotaxis protein